MLVSRRKNSFNCEYNVWYVGEDSGSKNFRYVSINFVPVMHLLGGKTAL